MAIKCFLAKFYNIPVKNAYGKKKPDIQNIFGVPLSIQFYKKSILATKS